MCLRKERARTHEDEEVDSNTFFFLVSTFLVAIRRANISRILTPSKRKYIYIYIYAIDIIFSYFCVCIDKVLIRAGGIRRSSALCEWRMMNIHFEEEYGEGRVGQNMTTKWLPFGTCIYIMGTYSM